MQLTMQLVIRDFVESKENNDRAQLFLFLNYIAIGYTSG